MQSLDLETLIKLLSVVGTAIAFAWGILQFSLTQRSQAQTRRIEATKPFLDRQLKLYTEATQSAASLATSKDEKELMAAAKRFWELYWGELALVEDQRVEAAMVQFGRAIQEGSTGGELQELSLAIAHACRDSLAEAWGVRQWRSPYRGSRSASDA